MSGLISLLIWGVIFWAIVVNARKKQAGKDGNKKKDTAQARSEDLMRQFHQLKQEAQDDLAAAVKDAAEEMKRKNDPARRKSHQSAQPREIREKKSADMVRSARVLRESTGMESLEDDRNDWLAMQLKEEQKSYRAVSEMFEVKMSHMHSCDAENLRLDHERECDARKLAETSRGK